MRRRLSSLAGLTPPGLHAHLRMSSRRRWRACCPGCQGCAPSLELDVRLGYSLPRRPDAPRPLPQSLTLERPAEMLPLLLLSLRELPPLWTRAPAGSVCVPSLRRSWSGARPVPAASRCWASRPLRNDIAGDGLPCRRNDRIASRPCAAEYSRATGATSRAPCKQEWRGRAREKREDSVAQD
jgi:hypothetical protein